MNQKPKLATELLASLKEHAFLCPGDRVGAAVSGGADSVALVRLLLELRTRLGVVVHILHFNHQLRGRASELDERFVTALASRLGLEFHSGRADVARLARLSKHNLEDTARRARYDWFAHIAAENHLARVATAHTADDQAETVLAHLLRGAGIAGLAGIHPVSGNIIRPLLGFRRAALRAYLKGLRQSWREDASNRDTQRTRARIRRELIPLLEKRFQPLAVEQLARLASRALENEALLAALSARAQASLVFRQSGGLCIRARDLLCPLQLAVPADLRALASRLILDLAAQIKARAGQLTAAHVHAVCELAKKGEPGKVLELPGGLRVRRERDALVFFAADSPRPASHL
jgi:tRNA(Ile)-lysidine synthase